MISLSNLFKGRCGLIQNQPSKETKKSVAKNMAQVKRCACIGILFLLCSSFSFASRILLDHNHPDDRIQKDTHNKNHRTDGSATSEQEAGSGIGFGYGEGGGSGGYGCGQGVGVGSGGYGYGSGSGVDTGYGGGSGTDIGIGQGSGSGYMSGGGTGTGIGMGTGGGNGGTGTGMGIGIGTGTVIPIEGCTPGVNCPNVPECGQPGYVCRQPLSGCPNCPPPQNGWKAESKGETHPMSPQDVNTKMANETTAEPLPPDVEETGIPIPHV